jgi:hypothetical protein
MYKMLNVGQGQGLWETLASMTYPQLLLIWLKIAIIHAIIKFINRYVNKVINNSSTYKK